MQTIAHNLNPLPMAALNVVADTVRMDAARALAEAQADYDALFIRLDAFHGATHHRMVVAGGAHRVCVACGQQVDMNFFRMDGSVDWMSSAIHWSKCDHAIRAVRQSYRLDDTCAACLQRIDGFMMTTVVCICGETLCTPCADDLPVACSALAS